MSLELRCAATAIGRFPHGGPQPVVPMPLISSLLVADAEDIFQPWRQTDESLGNEMIAKGYL